MTFLLPFRENGLILRYSLMQLGMLASPKQTDDYKPMEELTLQLEFEDSVWAEFTPS